MRQSIADWCFGGDLEPGAYYERVREIGYVGIEMPAPERWHTIRGAGLEIVNIDVPALEWGLNTESEHEAVVRLIEETIQLAATNGIRQIVVFSGNRRGIPDETGIENCAIGLARVAPLAEREDVTLVFEGLNSFGHVDYHADSSRFAFEVVRRVSSPNVKVLYDIFHMHKMGEPVLDDILRHLDVIDHLHVAGSPKRDFPGTDQEIDYPPLVREICSHGYDGLWGQEFLPGGDPLAELADAYTLFERAASTASSA